MLLERMVDDGTQLLEELMRFKPKGLTANAWAVRAGVGRTIWADLRRHGNPSRRTLEKLLAVAGSSLAEFEALRVGRPVEAAESAGLLADAGRGWGRAPLPPLPLLRTEPGGAWHDANHAIELITIDRHRVIDQLPRPAGLAIDREAYAVTIAGESMWPRFRSGRRLAVSPAAEVAAGDDVLVILADDRGALIGELRAQSVSAIGLRQFNPDVTFQLKAAETQAIHKVVGEMI